MEQKVVSKTPVKSEKPESLLEQFKKRKLQVLGLSVEFWVILFLIAGAIPLFNFVTLPAVFVAFGLGILAIIVGRWLRIET